MEKAEVKEKRYGIDWFMVFLIIILVGFGLLMIYSASSYQGQTEHGSALWYVSNQLRATAIALAVMVVAALIPYNFWNGFWSVAVFAVVMLLILLVLSPLGVEAYGARRWLDVGISVQPSELAKFALIIFTAFLLARNKDHLGKIKGFAYSVIPTFIAAGLVVVITEDLGTAIVIFAIGIVMAGVASPKKRYTCALIAILFICGVAFILTSANRSMRIKAWLNVEEYSGDESYQIIQALYAIASGGLFGKGLGKSTQKMGFIPESENDMIFSVICEELGVIGGLCLLILIGLLVWRMWKLYQGTDDVFGKMVIVGVIAHISLQTFLNVAVVSNLLPNTGVPLPFISYGGSSIITVLAEMGLVFSVARGPARRREKAPSGKKKRVSGGTGKAVYYC